MPALELLEIEGVQGIQDSCVRVDRMVGGKGSSLEGVLGQGVSAMGVLSVVRVVAITETAETRLGLFSGIQAVKKR